jgi:class 3 adenylate cyclase
MTTCAACGAENPTVARFCMSCGALLGSDGGAARELRKVVTVVFADVAGSTALGEHADPEAVRAALGRWFEAMRVAIERHGGTVEKFIGDAVVALFGVPVVHEDDALRAVRAAAEMRTALETMNAGGGGDRLIEMRVGVNTGEVVVGEARAGGSMATGDAVNVAARLQQAARPGEILIGESTWRLVRDAAVAEPLEPLAVRGREALVAARRLIAVQAAAEAVSRTLRAPLVGRARELRILRDAFDRVLAGPSPGLVTVLGGAGIGKSRLVHEFLGEVWASTLVLRGRCLSYGDGITWWPVVEILRSIAGVQRNDPEIVRARLTDALRGAQGSSIVASRLAELLGEQTTAGKDELFWAVRRLLEGLAAEQPVIVVLDDLHWAEPTLLDLVDHVLDWTRDVPLLILCMARPELLEARPGWGGGKSNSTSLALEPLAAVEIERLVDELTGGAALPPPVRERIAAAADGNPLYLEQVLEMLLDDGLLVPTHTGTLIAGDLAQVAIPPTVRALLAARLDRLAPPERATLERAAVVGKQFRRLEVAVLTPEADRPEVPARLLALARRELIRPDRAPSDLDETYRFRHLLIRDAAYEALPKRARADLHERFATWLESSDSGLAGLDEIAGHHLSEAVRLRDELGADDASTAPLRLRAGRRLSSAGSRALQRDDLPAAVRLLGRAAEFLAASPREAAEALRGLASAHGDSHDAGECAAAARAAVLAAERGGDTGTLYRTRIYEKRARAIVDPDSDLADSGSLLQEARDWAAEHDDVDTLMAVAWLEGWIELFACHWERARAAHERQLALALRLGRAHEADDARRMIGNALTWGAMPVVDAIARAETLRAEASSAFARAFMVSRLAILHATAGRDGEAARLLAESRGRVEELGIPWGIQLAEVSMWLCLDDIPAVIETSRKIIARLRSVGDTATMSTASAWLALALARAGRVEEAAEAVEESRALGAPDDIATQVGWRTAAAAVALAHDDTPAALAVATEAAGLARQTDAAIDIVQALLVLARACGAAGRDHDAWSALTEAEEIARRRGWERGLAQVEALGEELRGAPPA